MRHKKAEFMGWHNVDETGQPIAFYDNLMGAFTDRFLIATKPMWRTIVVDGVEFMEEVHATLLKDKLATGWKLHGHEKHNDLWYWVLTK